MTNGHAPELEVRGDAPSQGTQDWLCHECKKKPSAPHRAWCSATSQPPSRAGDTPDLPSKASEDSAPKDATS